MIEQGGGYVLTLKGNQVTLRDDAHLFLDAPATPLARDTQIGKGHGRIETRISGPASAPMWPGYRKRITGRACDWSKSLS